MSDIFYEISCDLYKLALKECVAGVSIKYVPFETLKEYPKYCILKTEGKDFPFLEKYRFFKDIDIEITVPFFSSLEDIMLKIYDRHTGMNIQYDMSKIGHKISAAQIISDLLKDSANKFKLDFLKESISKFDKELAILQEEN